jgi:16S rRNA C967 or C1407 C5-methylase (RsmB/RsmF family)/NOL1/NOP2/fmu family ribosome biogenesis protein
MLPEEFLERIKNQDYIDLNKLTEALGSPSPVSIRINPSKWNHKPEFPVPVPWCRDGYYLKARPSYTTDPLFHAGCYYPQEASGMFLEQAFNQLVTKNGYFRVLDLCGAPGGKSTHLSSLIGEGGLLVANEVIRQRAAILAENITKWGTCNTIVTNNDPSAFGKLNEYFDLIVVDAPCSGEGMFRDEVARNEWSVANTAHCSDRQKRILMDVWPSLKSGGILVYSTCTFNPEENENNINWLAETTDSETLKINISAFGGIREISFKNISGYGFYPDRIDGEGFFLSAVRKTGGSGNKIHNEKKLSYSSLQYDRKEAERLINGSLSDIYRHDDTVYRLSLPVSDFLFLKKYLRILKGGTALFKTRNNDISPFHDLAISNLIKENAFPKNDLDYKDALSFLRRENFLLKETANGWIIVTYLGVNLGFVKNLGSRFNNYFPVDWRIRMQAIINSDNNRIKWQDKAEP